MIRFIKVSNRPPNVIFTDMDDESRYVDYARIDKSWIISAKTISNLLLVGSMSNANKSKDPIEVYPLPLPNSFDDRILVLKTRSDDYSSIMIDMDVWELARKYIINSFVPVWPTKAINIITQYVNGKCTNPIIAISEYTKVSETVEPNGFKEHYLVNTKFEPTVDPEHVKSPLYRGCIIRSNGNNTNTIYYQMPRFDGFNIDELQHQINPV